MIPTNENKPGCVPQSSNCVQWQGPDIDLLNLCSNSSITEVIVQLADVVNEINGQLDISKLDLTNLNPKMCGPEDLLAVLQLIIDNINTIGKSESESFNFTVDVPDCLKTQSAFSCHDNMDVNTFSALIGSFCCELKRLIEENKKNIILLKETVDTIEEDVEELKNSKQDKLDIKSNNFDITDPSEAINKLLVLSYDYDQALGGAVDVVDASKKQCDNLDETVTFADATKKYKDLQDWTVNPSDMASSFSNLWTVVCDMRQKIASLMNEMPVNGLSIVDAWYDCLGNLNFKILYSETDGVTYSDNANLTISDGTNTDSITITDLNDMLGNNSSEAFSGVTFGVNYNITLTYSYTRDGQTYKTNTALATAYPIVSQFAVTETTQGSCTVTFNKISKAVVKLYRKIAGGNYSEIETYAQTDEGSQTFNDSGLTHGATYYYKLAAEGGQQCGEEVEFTVTPDSCTVIDSGVVITETVSTDHNGVGASAYTDWYNRYKSDVNQNR